MQNKEQTPSGGRRKRNKNSVIALLIFHAILFSCLIFITKGPARMIITGSLSVAITVYLFYNGFFGRRTKK